MAGSVPMTFHAADFVGDNVRFYDRSGAPISFEEWSATDHRRIARTTVGDRRVATTFLGMDPQGRGDYGASRIFETMVFDADNRPLRVMHWPSEAKAVAGHAEVVARMDLSHR